MCFTLWGPTVPLCNPACSISAILIKLSIFDLKTKKKKKKNLILCKVHLFTHKYAWSSYLGIIWLFTELCLTSPFSLSFIFRLWGIAIVGFLLEVCAWDEFRSIWNKICVCYFSCWLLFSLMLWRFLTIEFLMLIGLIWHNNYLRIVTRL